MKHFIILVIAFLTLAFMTNAQVTIQNINLIVPCCEDTDSIDIGNNGDYDILVMSRIGIDNVYYQSKPLHNNISFTDPLLYGSPERRDSPSRRCSM